MTEMSFTSGLGRTYRYWTGETPLFQFGHGLSYTSFHAEWASDTDTDNDNEVVHDLGASPLHTPLAVPVSTIPVPVPVSAPRPPVVFTSLKDQVTLTVRVTNTGARDGEEIIFLYHQPVNVPGAPAPLPKKRLIGFHRVAVSSSTHALHSPMGSAGAIVVTFTVDATMLGLTDNSGNTQLFPGEHNLRIEQGPLSPALIQSVKVDTAGPVLIESLF